MIVAEALPFSNLRIDRGWHGASGGGIIITLRQPLTDDPRLFLPTAAYRALIMLPAPHNGPSCSVQELAENATTLVWISDTSGTCTCLHADLATSVKAGMRFSLKDWMKLIHPEDRLRIKPEYDAALAARAGYQLEYRVARGDGTVRWLRSSAVPRMSDTGDFVGYIGAISESTALHDTLLKLSTSEAVLRLVTENSSDLISHHAADSGNYLYASPSSERLLGYTPEELLGTSCYDQFHPDDRQIVRAEIHRQATGETDSRQIEFRVRHYAGHYIWMGAKIRVLRDPVTGEKLGAVVVSRDIRAERQAREELRRSEERFRSLANLSADWYWETNEHGRFTFVSEGLQRIFGIAPAEVIGKTRFERAVDKNEAGLLAYLASVARRQSFRDIEYSVYVPLKGSIRHSAISGEPVFEAGKFVGYRGVGRDITERIQAERRLEQLATHDTLTGLPNRAFLHERLQHLIDTIGKKVPIAVMFIDLDRFKEVNDTLGHGPGDTLLFEVARRLRAILRPDDLIARLGGDEFVVAAPCSRGAHSATRLVEKLSKALAQPMEIAGQEVFVLASVGISMYPRDASSKEALLQAADIAMYKAKEGGRNGYRFFSEEMGAQIKERMTIENALHRALERDEFELHYQPRVDLKTMRVVGMEALIRWKHPQLGLVSPLEFIPLAEERGFIVAIGKWVLDEACRQTRNIHDRCGKALKVSVNLSARQLKEPDLVDQVRDALGSAGLLPGMLELELTETALVQDMSASTAAFERLKALGVSLAVDDFGTGYSGLAYLGQFPLDTFKLDRTFVNQKSEAGLGCRKVIRAFIKMAHDLGLKVVAEGIESDELLAFLKETGCDEAQGYLIARPMPADAFEAFISKTSRNFD